MVIAVTTDPCSINVIVFALTIVTLIAAQVQYNMYPQSENDIGGGILEIYHNPNIELPHADPHAG